MSRNLFATIAGRELIPAYGAGPVCFFAHNEEEKKSDKYQNRTSGQSQCAPGKKNKAKAGKHYYERYDINNNCIPVSIHNMLPIF
jgi:hypothetical protein